MAKGMSKELDREIRLVLGKFLSFSLGTEGYPRRPDNPREREAIEYLIDVRALEALTNATFDNIRAFDTVRITAYGREYYKKLTAPLRYWLMKNWFRIAGLAVTLIIGLTAIIANVIF